MQGYRWRAVLLGCALAAGSASCAAPASPADPKALLADATHVQVRDFWTNDFGRERRGGGYSAVVSEADAERIVFALRARLPPGYIAFAGTTRNLEDPKATGAEIVVAPGKDQFDILRLAATDGVNYDLDTEQIIARLRQWDAAFGIDIWYAETDTVRMKLRALPPDPKGFAKALYGFCPDIVDQGVGDMDALERQIAEDRAIYLWWD
jgi:hypothetical protein